MDRKKFIKTSGLGLGLTMFPMMVQCQDTPENGNLSADIGPKIVKDGEGETLNVIGDIQSHKLIGAETGNQIVEWVSDIEPGVGIPPHIHTNEDEIFRVIKGQIEIMVNGETTVLNEGDIAYAPKNVSHAWTVVGTEKAKMITSAFPSGIELMFAELAELPAGPPDFEKVSEICGRYGVDFV